MPTLTEIQSIRPVAGHWRKSRILFGATSFSGNSIIFFILIFLQLSILNAASIFGRVLPNFVADKTGPFNMIIPFSFSTAVLLFGWLGVTTRAGLVVFALLYGFFSGAFISLLPSCFMVCLPSTLAMCLCLGCWFLEWQTLAFNVGEMGIRVGIGYIGNAFAALTGMQIQFVLLVMTHGRSKLDRDSNCGVCMLTLVYVRDWLTGPWFFRALLGDELKWWKPTVFSGISVFAGTALLALARHLHAKEKGTWKV